MFITPTSSQAVPLIVAPTAFECAAIKRPIQRAIARGDVRLSQCGVGIRHAANFCQNLDPNIYTHLLLLGWAGGLAEGLKPGDVVCALAALMQGQPELRLVPLPLAGNLIAGNNPMAREGSILTVPLALISPTEKRAAQETGAIAVEMEAYPMAAWAQSHDIPFSHVRVILDAWDEPLPDLGPGINSTGRFHLTGFLRQLVKRPGLVSDLVRLNRRIRALNPVLGQMAVDVLSTINDESH